MLFGFYDFRRCLGNNGCALNFSLIFNEVTSAYRFMKNMWVPYFRGHDYTFVQRLPFLFMPSAELRPDKIQLDFVYFCPQDQG